MSLQLKSLTTQRIQPIAALVMFAVVFVLGCSKKQENRAAEAPQKTFATPAEASQALHAAVQAKDDKDLTQVLGPKALKLVRSGDPAEDKSATDSFAKKYDQMNRLVAMTDGSQVQVNDAFLRDAILNPSQHITAGYAPIMPTYQGQISEDGLIDLVEYIKAMQTNYRVQQTLTTSTSNQAAPTTPGVVKP